MKRFFAFLVLMITTISLACNTLIPNSSPTLIAPPTECVEFKLTPEECANAGTHEYTASTQILFDQTGKTCLEDSGDITISFKFLPDNKLHYSNSFEVEKEFERKDSNVYTGGYIQPDGKFEWKNSITFTGDGFTEEANSYDLEENALLCTFVWEHKIK